MVTIRRLLAAAGFGHIPAGRLLAVLTACVLGFGLSLVKLTGVLGVGIAGSVLCLAGCAEASLLLGRRRESALVASLPEVAESLASSVASGLSLPECLATLDTDGPISLRKSFQGFNTIQNQGYTLEQALVWLQVEFSNVYGDQLVQLLLVSLRVGGVGLVLNLNALASDIRSQAALDAELQAKQGWVSGTAKLGLIAPWLIVLFLNQRPEAHAFYASPAGLQLLLLGQLVCLLAYGLIQLVSGLPKPRRVFIDVA